MVVSEGKVDEIVCGYGLHGATFPLLSSLFLSFLFFSFMFHSILVTCNIIKNPSILLLHSSVTQALRIRVSEEEYYQTFMAHFPPST